MSNQTLTSAMQSQPAILSRWERGCERIFKSYPKQFVVFFTAIGLATLFFVFGAVSSDVGQHLPDLGAAFGNLAPVLCLYLIASALVAGCARRIIPFSFAIEQPPVERQPGLLKVLCAAMFEHMRVLFEMPAERIATTISNHHFIQPPQPVRGGIAHLCITPRLLTSPDSIPA